jgi:CDP-diacylglycerol--glycerol-3-phosphate 3-phosphatidyltransferase
MGRPDIGVWLIQAISPARLIGALVFASIALQGFSPILVATVYTLAACSDLIDGYVARKLDVETFAGKIIDLISDKSLTVVSLLYAAAVGVDILPLAVIATLMRRLLLNQAPR